MDGREIPALWRRSWKAWWRACFGSSCRASTTSSTERPFGTSAKGPITQNGTGPIQGFAEEMAKWFIGVLGFIVGTRKSESLALGKLDLDASDAARKGT